MVVDWNWQMVRGRGWKLAENWELELVGAPEQERYPKNSDWEQSLDLGKNRDWQPDQVQNPVKQ